MLLATRFNILMTIMRELGTIHMTLHHATKLLNVHKCHLCSSVSAGVHGGGRDVPGRRDQGDQSDQGSQATPHAPVTRITKKKNVFPAHLSTALTPHLDLHLVSISEKEPQHSPASTSYLWRGRCLEYKYTILFTYGCLSSAESICCNILSNSE